MKICIKIDTKPKGHEYMRAGSIVEVDEREGSRLIYLGFADAVKARRTAKKKEV